MRYVDDIIVLWLDAEVSEELQQIIDITIERKGFTIAEEKRVSLNNAEVYPILWVSLLPNKTFQIPTRTDRDLAYRIKYHDPEERESVDGQLNYNNYVSTLWRTGVKTQSGLFYSPRVAHVLGKSALQK